MKIDKIKARQILDSRGNPTVEANVFLTDQTMAKGIAPSGASTGKYEAVELRDKDMERYMGKGVTKAVDNVNTIIDKVLKGTNVLRQSEIDNLMKMADGTEDKSELGANAIISVSIACARAGAKFLDVPLYRYIGGICAVTMPVPMMNILNGGCHAKNNLDFQEFMIMPVGASSFKEALRMGTEVYHTLKKVLDEKNMAAGVGDEGGFAPDVSDAKEALNLLLEAVKKAGYTPGKDFVFAMDAAASELYDKEQKKYYFEGETKSKKNSSLIGKISRNADEMIAYYEELVNEFPLASIEDGLDEEDFEGWRKLTEKLGDRIQLVGDDLFVTNTKRLKTGIEKKCANSILIKFNQIGSLTETIEAINMAKEASYTAIVSHRSGETEDTTIADLSVALNCGQIKTGAPCRSERVAKYNRLLRIEEQLGTSAVYPGISAIKGYCHN